MNTDNPYTVAFEITEEVATNILDPVHQNAQHITICPFDREDVYYVMDLEHVMMVCSQVYGYLYGPETVEALCGDSNAPNTAALYHHYDWDSIEDRLEFRFSQQAINFMLMPHVMEFLGGICNDNIRFLYRFLPRMSMRNHNDPTRCNDDVVKVLRYLGDNGCYRWIDTLDYHLFPITKNMTEYFIQSPQFCQYVMLTFISQYRVENYDVATGKHVTRRVRRRTSTHG